MQSLPSGSHDLTVGKHAHSVRLTEIPLKYRKQDCQAKVSGWGSQEKDLMVSVLKMKDGYGNCEVCFPSYWVIFSKNFSIPANWFYIFSATNISAKLDRNLTNK